MATTERTIWFPKSARYVVVLVTLWLTIGSVAAPALRAVFGNDAVSGDPTLL